MATPFVAAAAALAFATNPAATAAQVRVALLAAARPLPSLAGRTVSGGIIDAAAVLDRIDSEPAPGLRSAVGLPPGPPAVGQPLSATGGTFDRGALTWSWQRCDATGFSCSLVSGALAATYTPVAGDLGMRLRVTATATSLGGSTASSSALSDPVLNATSERTPDAAVGGPAPTPPVPPAVVGHAPAAPAKTPTIASTVVSRWSVHGSRLTLLRLLARKLPQLATVRIACAGSRCPFKTKTVLRPSGGSTDLLRALGRVREFRAGQTLQVRVSAPGYNASVLRFALRTGKHARAARSCVRQGSTLPRRTC